MGVGAIGSGISAGGVLSNINIAGGRKTGGKDDEHYCEKQLSGPVHAFLQESYAGPAILSEPAGRSSLPVGEWQTIYWMTSPL